MILATIILMDILTGMEFDLFVPSFPELQKQFNLLPFWTETLLSVNFLGYCISLFFVGNLADRYGRKPIILYGIIIFIFGSILCLSINSYNLLLIGRFLQGIGIAAPAILSFLIIADSYPIKQQQSLVVLLNGFMNAAAGVAPIIGSYVTIYFSWRGNFFVLLVLGIITFIMTIIFIPAYKLSHLPRENSGLYGYILIFKLKPLALLIVHFIFNFVPYWIFVGISPLLYMEDLKVSLAHFGYYQGALAFTFALGSVLFGRIVNKFEQKRMLLIAALILIVSLISISFAAFTNSYSPLLITLAFIPFVLGQIITSAILYPICLNFMPEAKGRVSAILQGGRLMFSAFSLQIAGYYYQGSFQNVGIILISLILVVVITLLFVINNQELMKFIEE